MVRQIGHSQNRPTTLLSLTWKIQQSADELLAAKTGVGLSQVRILAMLDKSVTCSQATVAKELGQTQANVSRQLRIMKRRGLVTINKNKQDHRQRDVCLSPKGWRLYAKAEQALNHYEKGLLSTMSRGEARDFADKLAGLVHLV